MGATIEAQGIPELVRALREFGERDLAAELQSELRQLAIEAVEIAKANAQREGFAAPGRSKRGKGLLLQDIGYSVRGGAAYLREYATNKGYKYPAIYEFSRDYKGGEMHRPFMVPAINQLEPEFVHRMGIAANRAVESFNS